MSTLVTMDSVTAPAASDSALWRAWLADADDAERWNEATMWDARRAATWPALRRAILEVGGIETRGDYSHDLIPGRLYRRHGCPYDELPLILAAAGLGQWEDFESLLADLQRAYGEWVRVRDARPGRSAVTIVPNSEPTADPIPVSKLEDCRNDCPPSPDVPEVRDGTAAAGLGAGTEPNLPMPGMPGNVVGGRSDSGPAAPGRRADPDPRFFPVAPWAPPGPPALRILTSGPTGPRRLRLRASRRLVAPTPWERLATILAATVAAILGV